MGSKVCCNQESSQSTMKKQSHNWQQKTSKLYPTKQMNYLLGWEVIQMLTSPNKKLRPRNSKLSYILSWVRCKAEKEVCLEVCRVVCLEACQEACQEVCQEVCQVVCQVVCQEVKVHK